MLIIRRKQKQRDILTIHEVSQAITHVTMLSQDSANNSDQIVNKSNEAANSMESITTTPFLLLLN